MVIDHNMTVRALIELRVEADADGHARRGAKTVIAQGLDVGGYVAREIAHELKQRGLLTMSGSGRGSTYDVDMLLPVAQLLGDALTEPEPTAEANSGPEASPDVHRTVADLVAMLDAVRAALDESNDTAAALNQELDLVRADRDTLLSQRDDARAERDALLAAQAERDQRDQEAVGKAEEAIAAAERALAPQA